MPTENATPVSSSNGNRWSPKQLLIAGCNGLEHVVVVLVILLLSGTALMLTWNAGGDLWHALTGSGSEHALTSLLSQALLILMIAEIIGTMGSFLERGSFDPMPFLIVGLIASIRRLLVISAEVAEYVRQASEVPVSFLIELGILAVLIAIFAWAINLLRSPVNGEATRSIPA